MAKIIGLVQVKGGVGRSTVATNLAAILSRDAPTALIDCDMPQGTSMSWYALRKAENPNDPLTLATATEYKELAEHVQRLKQSKDYIIIDAPPRIAEITQTILILSDLTIIPLGASAAEIWATSDLLATIEKVKARKQQIDYRIMWNRYRGHTKSARELSVEVRDQIDAAELGSRFGYRVAFSDCMAVGKSADEWHDPAARAEVDSLGREIMRILENENA